MSGEERNEEGRKSFKEKKIATRKKLEERKEK